MLMYSCILVDMDPGGHDPPWLAIYFKADNVAMQAHDGYAVLVFGRSQIAVDSNVRYGAKVTPTFLFGSKEW